MKTVQKIVSAVVANGAVLLIVAMAFGVGTRLQRDTEGLV